MPRDLVWARVRHASLLDLESHKKEPDAGDHFHVGLASSRGGGSSAKTGTRVFHSARRSKGSARRRFDANTIRHSAKGRARHACATRRARFLGRKKQRLGGPLRRRLEASARPRFGANTIPQKKSPTRVAAARRARFLPGEAARRDGPQRAASAHQLRMFWVQLLFIDSARRVTSPASGTLPLPPRPLGHRPPRSSR
jgi:hypothetical protein